MDYEDFALAFLLLPESRAIYSEAVMRRPMPDVYHYTTRAGLEGILASRRLWATDARYLNDESELIYSEGLIRDVLIGESRKVHKDYRPWVKEFSQVVARVFSAERLYVASFCEQGDLLSQWRGYATAGFCIHFDGDRLARLRDCHFMRVVYRPSEQRAIIRKTLAVHLQALEVARETSQRAIDRVSANFGAQISLYAACFKNPAFAEEREWRAVTSHAVLPLRHREVDGVATPYVEVPLTRDGDHVPLRAVIHAPSRSRFAAKSELEAILSRYGYDASCGRASTIPLRV